MLPFSIDVSKIGKEDKQKANEKKEAERKSIRSKLSQQALANRLVLGSMPQSGTQIQQNPAGN